MASPFDNLVNESLESFASGPEVFLLQIGAGDGVTGDFLHEHLCRKGWRALLLEPYGPAFDILRKTYAEIPAITCCQMAVSDHDGIQNLYSVRDNSCLPWWASQLPSLISDVVLSHQSLIPGLAELLEVTTVPCRRIQSLLKTYSIAKIHVAAIDAEGMDGLIVSDILDVGINPEVMLFEHKHLEPRVRVSLNERLQEEYSIVIGSFDTLCARRKSPGEQLIVQYEKDRGP